MILGEKSTPRPVPDDRRTACRRRSSSRLVELSDGPRRLARSQILASLQQQVLCLLSVSRGRWLELVRKGIDPQIAEERQRQVELRQRRNTFAAVAEDFIADKLPGERKGRECERDIRRELLPLWAKRPIAEITAQDVRDIMKAAKERGAPYQAHNILVLARRLFSWAIDQHVYGLETSPCDRLKPKAIIGKKVFRTRVLDDDELRAFWRATRRLGYPYGPLFRMLALTGQRKSEVAEARWSEFDRPKKCGSFPLSE